MVKLLREIFVNIKSPNRRSGEYVHALLNETDTVSLNETDFKEIEKAGNCKFTKNSREKIEKALNSFLVSEALRKEKYTRGELANYLKEISKAAKTLSDILSDQSNHAVRTACFKMDDEFEEAIGQVGFELSARWDLVQKTYCGNLNLEIDDQIDYKFLADNCLLMTSAADLAVEKMNENIADDIGGKEENSFNALVVYLNQPYKTASGKKGGFERFVEKCITFIPEKHRPDLPAGAGSINAIIKRSTNKN